MSKADRFRKLAEGKQNEDVSQNKHDVIDAIAGVTQADSEQEKRNNKTEQSNVTVLSNTINEKESGIENSKSKLEQGSEIEVSNTDGSEEQQSEEKEEDEYKQPDGTEFMKQFTEKTKKPTVEDTHTRQTYLVRNDLIKRLDKLARRKDRGFKTQLVNFALEKILDELEG